MSETKRYIIASKRGPSMHPEQRAAIDSVVGDVREAATLKSTSVGREVRHLSHDQCRRLCSARPDLIVEEDHPLELFGMPGLPPRAAAVAEDAAHILTVQVADERDGSPLEDVTIFALGEAQYRAETDENGVAVVPCGESHLRAVIASPRKAYWSRVQSDIRIGPNARLAFRLGPLPLSGGYDWGHRIMGFASVQSRFVGRDVRVGVIDSGVRRDHVDLHPRSGFNTLDGEDPDEWYNDLKGHGSHCAGVIAAVPNRTGVLGGAPAAEINALRVFPGGRVSDLVEAVEWCIRNRMDVISMSLGSRQPSEVMHQVLTDAHARGITCVAAAGNDGGPVSFPAAFPEVIAVGAIGQFGAFPGDSGHALKVGRVRDWTGRLFNASFTNFGPEVDFCAPGVAITSTVPGGYASWDGTSMACPMVTALVALVLEAFPAVRTGDATQSQLVKLALQSGSTPLGMPAVVQGAGLPIAPRTLLG
jgi:subtilisin family serine protease